MSTFLYINDVEKNTKILKDIEFANYLLKIDFFKKNFFEVFTDVNKIEKVIQAYTDFFNKKRCIIIPKNISKSKLSFWKKRHLKNPENVFNYMSYFEDCADFIQFKNLDLVDLDKNVAKYFATGYKKVNKHIILNNNLSRYSQYSYIVSGIGSTKIRYYNIPNNYYSFIFKTLKEELFKIYEKNPNLKNYIAYFSLGMTSISTRGLQFEIN